MLQALELIGFKSFANKTRFEFPPGITVVVGPNGSGKSNVVDAIKWVLGEQSVKSLRGKEMADVIFNGSGSRKPINTAEATLTFDNSQGLLAVDTAEVHITRRVYRSGEGEYLINRQPCRLRDIRDLFAGTGAATEAYSVIEQGKVDILLQASPRDRRMIFEEAAGISRFKSKKLESQRRLDRVEQNLLRLSDIVEEVENRLRSVRMQASKARRYKEYSDRLQELRTQVGMTDWRALTERLDRLEAELAKLTSSAEACSTQLADGEQQIAHLENEMSALDEEIRQSELVIGKSRESIAAAESTVEHQRQSVAHQNEEIARHRRHLTAMQTRSGDLEQLLTQVVADHRAAQSEFEAAQKKLTTDDRALQELTQTVGQLRQQADSLRAEHMEMMRAGSQLSNQISAARSQATAAEKTLASRDRQVTQLQQQRDEVAKTLTTATAALDQLQTTTATLETDLASHRAGLEEQRRQATRLQQKLSQLEGRHAGAQERATVLDELEKRLEGVSAGVKEVLLKAREAGGGPFRHVRGLVADLLAVNVETAPLVEVALGEMAHFLVIAPGDELLDELETCGSQLAGRVDLLRMDSELPDSPADRIDLSQEPGVVQRADGLVETAAEFIPLLRHLLGHTWIVETLADARRLAQGAGQGLNFVTLAGERLTASGTITVGPRQTATGLISRRSELRSLQATTEQLATKITAMTAEVTILNQGVKTGAQRVKELTTQYEESARQLRDQQLITSSAEQRQHVLDEQIDRLQAEIQSASMQRDAAQGQQEKAAGRLKQTEAQLAELETSIDFTAQRLATLEADRGALSREATLQQVQLAKSEQRLDSLRQQLEQLQRDRQERHKALQDTFIQLAQCLTRQRQSQRQILHLTSEIAELYLDQQQQQADVTIWLREREAYRQQRRRIQDASQTIRQRLRGLEEKIHAQQLAAGEVRHQRSTMAQRLREDYDIDLAAEQHHHLSAEEEHERETVEQEIGDLRRKLNNIGNVNLDALAELEELESRFGSLSAQYEDLTKAKSSLEQIIGKINADSRRLFAETLETARGHFQTLFRKLFGGGQADIVLDADEDILECGIEIVARPPGKEPRNISLLSGGEKTLTCVALLLAIFKSRPSPFCVLDEVDAALDEANIERFVNVLKEFLQWTQFIVVTHSKKTMTCASTLYGVTMQESGISKRVSVRFDDVSEDGHIAQAAIDREEETASETASDDETQAA